jgi:NTE family protein
VVIATLAKTSDQVMRATNTAEVVVDMTGSGASWLRATARQYWAMPISTHQEMARLARKLGGRTTALILSGGMARTLAHLGVIDVLVDAQISFDLLAGCGYGALWGALLALGWSPQEIIEWALQAAPRLNPLEGRQGMRPLARPGLFDARKVRALIQDAVGSKRFSELVTPCCLAANDLDTGEVIWLQEGTVFSALSACIAAPGLVTPVKHQKRLLTDALLSNPLPADAAVAANVDIALACSTIPLPQTAPADRPRDLVTNWVGLSQAIAYGRTLDHLGAIDLLIAPDVADLGPLDFEHAEQLIERGRKAAEKSLDRIRALF